MSPIDRRRLALIGAAAFALRLGLAFATERHPLFPDYYYTDARLIDAGAAAAYSDIRAGNPYGYVGSLSQRFQVRTQTAVYQLVGPRPFAMKILHSLLGAVGVVVLGVIAAVACGPAAGLSTAVLCAAWPSNVFYTSQNFKEAPTNLFAYLALALLLLLLAADDARGARALALAALATAALIVCGFYRSYVMLVVGAAAAASLVWRLTERRGLTASAAACAAAIAAAWTLYLPASHLTMKYLLVAPQANDPRLAPMLMPVTYETSNMRSYRPTSPVGLTHFRRIRQFADRTWAERKMGREIGTQIFPNEDFFTWLDVALFVPKAAFHVLFMPLPLLYPMEAKVGRMLAAGENLLLLALTALGVLGACRRPLTPVRVALLSFFSMMTIGSSLLEFDLGSAGRHKLLYLPMLFPFAAEETLRRLGRKESA